MTVATARGLALASTILLAACATAPASPDATDAAEATQVDAEPGDPALVSAAQRRFAADMLEHASAEAGAGENVFLSPYSIHAALGMTLAGARGETADEMAAAMGLSTLPAGRRHAAMSAHAEALVIEPVPEDLGDAFAFSTANRVWVAQDIELLAPFAATTRDSYGAEAASVDFGASEAARTTINAWISAATMGRIPELIPEGVLDPDTRLVLTNALYFKGSWVKSFRWDATEDADFVTPGGPVTVSMMRANSRRYRYASEPDYEILSMPYLGGADMLVILPRAGKLDQVSKALRGGGLDAVMSADLVGREIVSRFPKFTFRVPFEVNDALEASGIERAFIPGVADFSGMYAGARAEKLHVSAVLHEAFITIDEAGTEAAATSSSSMVLISGGLPDPLQFTVDRPFFFVIRHTATNTPLFVGRVLDPTRN